MIVWSRGLGKQRLPIELPDATLHVKPDMLTLEGVIEPVCWNYAVKIETPDLIDFLQLLAHPETSKFLAERGGLLLPFLGGLIRRVPGVAFAILFSSSRKKQRAE